MLDFAEAFQIAITEINGLGPRLKGCNLYKTFKS